MPVVVVVSPATITLSPLATQQFTPYVGNTTNLGIAWSITEGGRSGSITGDGLYTSPLDWGTYHVVVTSLADPSKSATATITVANRVAVSPQTVSATLSDTIAFSASVPGPGSQAVSWRVLESGGGTISASGVYTAPRVAGTYHVIATCVEDPAKSGVAVLTIASGGLQGGIK